MSQLSSHAADYLELRRALGFKLAKEGRLLPDFAAFTEAAGAGTVTVDLAIRWAAKPDGTSPVWAAQRLSMVRGFARYLQTMDPDAQVPPAGLLPARTRRVTPCIYSDADIAALMTAARTLRNPLKAATFETLVGLLAVTGMRGSEAMRLDDHDLDAAGVLTRHQVPQVPPAAPAPGHSPGARQLPGAARRSVPGAGHGQPAGVFDRGAAVP
jgi:integrase/recombinase XerD